MARGIIENWKQPLAYYLVNESCSSDIVKEKLTDAITKLENIGLNVLGVVSDIGSNFQKFVREMGITPENPWFIHNGKTILYIFDAPHIIKAIRNNLINYNFHFDNKVASWNDIEALYKIDSKNSIRCCPKLTNKHMHPNGFLKMKVKLATYVLSHSVAAALMMAISGGLLPTSASGTSELVSHFDYIFYCLNSSTFSTPKECNQPVTASSKHMQTMKEKLEFVNKIKVIDAAKNKDVTSSLKCLNALQIPLHSTMELWKTVQGNVKFLCTRRLNQDPLENFLDPSDNKVATVIILPHYNSPGHLEKIFLTIIFFQWVLVTVLQILIPSWCITKQSRTAKLPRSTATLHLEKKKKTAVYSRCYSTKSKMWTINLPQ